MIPVIFNWSGGKDSSLALYKIMQEKKYEVKYLLTTLNAENQRISMHGVRKELLQQQADKIGIPLKMVFLDPSASLEEYNKQMANTLAAFQEEGIKHAVFGDIFLEDLKQYRDDRLKEAGFTGVYPLWKMDSSELVKEFVSLGFKTTLVCINNRLLDKEFCGRTIDNEFIKDLPHNVDPAGENGEFHTFAYDGPIFKEPVDFSYGEVVERSYTNPSEPDKNISFSFRELLEK